jgi:hypothetical protein
MGKAPLKISGISSYFFSKIFVFFSKHRKTLSKNEKKNIRIFGKSRAKIRIFSFLIGASLKVPPAWSCGVVLPPF